MIESLHPLSEVITNFALAVVSAKVKQGFLEVEEPDDTEELKFHFQFVIAPDDIVERSVKQVELPGHTFVALMFATGCDQTPTDAVSESIQPIAEVAINVTLYGFTELKR